VRRTGSDNDPTALTGDFDIHNRLETKVADEKPPASFLIANPHRREIEPQEWTQRLYRARVARSICLIGLSLAFHLPEIIGYVSFGRRPRWGADGNILRSLIGRAETDRGS
jgi:hypothetical protein